MKKKLLNAFLILTSLLGYLEWGGGNKMFLFQAEQEIVTKLFQGPLSVAHPFILLPLFGLVADGWPDRKHEFRIQPQLRIKTRQRDY